MEGDKKMNGNKFQTVFICIFGVLFGRILNRVLTTYFGNNGSNIAISIAGGIIICAILYLVIKGYYKAAIQSIVIMIPLFIGGIGVYLNNMHMIDFSLIVIIICPILVKIFTRIKS